MWFPGIDDYYIYCQANTSKTRMHRELLEMTELPGGPWNRVIVNFCEPLAIGNLT